MFTCAILSFSVSACACVCVHTCMFVWFVACACMWVFIFIESRYEWYFVFIIRNVCCITFLRCWVYMTNFYSYIRIITKLTFGMNHGNSQRFLPHYSWFNTAATLQDMQNYTYGITIQKHRLCRTNWLSQWYIAFGIRPGYDTADVALYQCFRLELILRL